MNAPLRIAVTGAAGQIGDALLFGIASGSMFGPDQPVIQRLVEIEPAIPALNGVVMELEECAFPLLKGTVASASLDVGFRDTNALITMHNAKDVPAERFLAMTKLDENRARA